jgi:hypothetical protein
MTAAKRTRPSPSGASEDSMTNWAFSWGLPPSANPWAWSGAAPIARQTAQAALASVDTIELAFNAWRRWIDASQAALRAQQDTMLGLYRSQLRQAAGATAEAKASSPAEFLSPMMAAARAYEEVGEAVLEAQRGAVEALSTSKRPH